MAETEAHLPLVPVAESTPDTLAFKVHRADLVLKDREAVAELQKEAVKRLLGRINNDPDPAATLPKFEKQKVVGEVNEKNFGEAIRDLTKNFNPMKLIKLVFKLFFGKANQVEGLGLKLIDKFEKNPDKARVVAQLDKINQEKLGWKDRVGTSLSTQLHELSLYRAGYHAKTVEATTRVKIRPGQKIKDVAGAEKWAELQQAGVLNTLDYDKALPPCGESGNYHLYLDKRGFPIYISLNPNEKPRVLLFEKEQDETARAEMEKTSGFEFFKSKLEVGDVLWVYAQSGTLPRLIRAGQKDKSFPFTHMLVYLGGGEVAHIHSEGGKVQSLESAFGKDKLYNAVCVTKISGEDGQRFATEARRWAESAKGYDWKTIATEAGEAISGGPSAAREKRKGDALVCTDLFNASSNPELKKALAAGTVDPYSLFQLGCFRAKYASQGVAA